MKKILTTALLLSMFTVAAEAKTVKAVAPVQPSVLNCVLLPFPGVGCPIIERVVGAGLWGAAIGLTAGSALATVPVVHAVAYGTAIGAGVGAASPLVVH